MPFIATLNHHDDGNETLRQDGAKRVEQSHIDGIALLGSFLLPLESLFAWIMQEYSKGVPRPLPGFCYFLFAKKESNQRKVAAARCLSREFLAPALPDAADARVVSDCVGRFGDFARHSSFAESSLICC